MRFQPIKASSVLKELLTLINFARLVYSTWNEIPKEAQTTSEVLLILDSVFLLIYFIAWIVTLIIQTDNDEEETRYWWIDLADDIFTDLPIMIFSGFVYYWTHDWWSALVVGPSLWKLITHMFNSIKWLWWHHKQY
jgi:hypothetical protein